MFDHVPFTEGGYDAVSLIAIGRASWSIHTSQDTANNLHIRGFDQAGRLAIRVIDKLSGSEIYSKQNNHLE